MSVRLAIASALFLTLCSYAAAADGTTTWGGLSWGIGIAADFDVTGSRVVGATTVNNIVRVTDTSSNVNVGFVLEAHYFLRDYYTKSVAASAARAVCLDYCNADIAWGPFVAIEVGNGTSSTPDANGLVTGYALGWMVGLHHPKFDSSNNDTSTSSWNLGLGLRVDPKAQVLGDGLIPNQPLPAGDAIRYKTEPRIGVMLLSSFSF
jgi:hypothetical protein